MFPLKGRVEWCWKISNDVFQAFKPEKNYPEMGKGLDHLRNLALGFAFIPASVGAFVVLERETGSKHLQVSWRHWEWVEWEGKIVIHFFERRIDSGWVWGCAFVGSRCTLRYQVVVYTQTKMCVAEMKCEVNYHTSYWFMHREEPWTVITLNSDLCSSRLWREWHRWPLSNWPSRFTHVIFQICQTTTTFFLVGSSSHTHRWFDMFFLFFFLRICMCLF